MTAPPTFSSRWLAPLLPEYAAAGGVGIDLDISTDARDSQTFDVAIRTGTGGWLGLREFPLFPVDVTPMLAPKLQGERTLNVRADLASFTLLPHPDWDRWFAEARGATPGNLRFVEVDYPTHELNAAAALEGLGVALLSPSLFRPLLDEGRLLSPFPHVLRGPAWHFALMRSDDTRASTQHL